MRATVAILLALTPVAVLGSAPATAQESASVLQLADQGFLACHSPNADRKTCKSIETLERVRDDLYNSTTLMAVGHGVTLEIYTPLWVVDDIVCGSIREQDLMAGVVRLNGREIAPQLAAPALDQALQQVRPFLDQQICTRYQPSGADFVAKNALGETYRPDWDEPVKMIDPADGYRVAR